MPPPKLLVRYTRVGRIRKDFVYMFYILASCLGLEVLEREPHHLCDIHEPSRVPPLVVIPGVDLDHGPINNLCAGSINNGGLQ
jgi:hypothetical protein